MLEAGATPSADVAIDTRSTEAWEGTPRLPYVAACHVIQLKQDPSPYEPSLPYTYSICIENRETDSQVSLPGYFVGKQWASSVRVVCTQQSASRINQGVAERLIVNPVRRLTISSYRGRED